MNRNKTYNLNELENTQLNNIMFSGLYYIQGVSVYDGKISVHYRLKEDGEEVNIERTAREAVQATA
jgi:hypothetical protein